MAATKTPKRRTSKRPAVANLIADAGDIGRARQRELAERYRHLLTTPEPGAEDELATLMLILRKTTADLQADREILNRLSELEAKAADFDELDAAYTRASEASNAAEEAERERQQQIEKTDLGPKRGKVTKARLKARAAKDAGHDLVLLRKRPDVAALLGIEPPTPAAEPPDERFEGVATIKYADDYQGKRFESKPIWHPPRTSGDDADPGSEPLGAGWKPGAKANIAAAHRQAADAMGSTPKTPEPATI